MTVYLKSIFVFLFFFFPLEGKARKKIETENYEACIYLMPTGQRLGDRLLEYVKAKWISYKTGLPLYVRPSIYYDNFKILEKENTLSAIPKKGVRKIWVDDYPTFLYEVPNTFYIVSYYPFPSMEMIYEFKRDKTFISLLRETICLINPVPLIKPPEDQISVAVHIRKGSGGDGSLKSKQIFDKGGSIIHKIDKKNDKYSDLSHPLKFPPEQYYIDQIKYLSAYFDNQPIYLYLFTDQKNPQSLLERVQSEVGLENISYHCRKKVFQSREVVLSDFFSMMEFDCIIRSGESNFSIMSELVSDHKIVIYPKSYHFERDKKRNYYLIMDDIEVVNENN